MDPQTQSFYVYIDRTNADEAFYVGKGNTERVADTAPKARNKKHGWVVREHGLKRETVASFDSEDEALEQEQELIAELHTFVGDPSSDELACNFTTGGEGCSGYRHPQETRDRMSAKRKGRPAWNKGRSPSEQTRAKISKARKGMTYSLEARAKMSEQRKGRRHSAATRAKMSAAGSKPVLQIDATTGLVMARYASVNAAAAAIGAPASSIALYSREGRAYRGSLWRRDAK